MTEADLMRAIQLRATWHGARLFRNNVAKAWVGTVRKIDHAQITLGPYRILHAGLGKGSSDLIGWTSDGKMLAVEVKTNSGRPTREQRAFIDAARAAGCVAGVVRSVEDLDKLLGVVDGS